MADEHKLRRYRLSLSSFSGLVFGASHWWCRIRWTDDDGEYQEADVEHGRGDNRTGRFNTKPAARAAGLRFVRKLAAGQNYIVTEGSSATIDPQRTLIAPDELKKRLNTLWRKFEKLDGWAAPKSKWQDVQKICDDWSNLIGEYHG